MFTVRSQCIPFATPVPRTVITCGGLSKSLRRESPGALGQQRPYALPRHRPWPTIQVLLREAVSPRLSRPGVIGDEGEPLVHPYQSERAAEVVDGLAAEALTPTQSGSVRARTRRGPGYEFPRRKEVVRGAVDRRHDRFAVGRDHVDRGATTVGSGVGSAAHDAVGRESRAAALPRAARPSPRGRRARHRARARGPPAPRRPGCGRRPGACGGGGKITDGAAERDVEREREVRGAGVQELGERTGGDARVRRGARAAHRPRR